MAETKRKGDIGEAMVMAEAMKRGYKVAIPVGEDWRYDLIVLRHGNLDRVQCKFVTSDGATIRIPCRSANGHSVIKYTPQDIDWIAVYDTTTDGIYFVPSNMLGDTGRATLTLRLKPPKNNQKKGVLWAKDFTDW